MGVNGYYFGLSGTPGAPCWQCLVGLEDCPQAGGSLHGGRIPPVVPPPTLSVGGVGDKEASWTRPLT